MNSGDKPEWFNYKRFGAQITEYRERAGYKTYQDFCDVIYRKTGCWISSETLRKLEKGTGKPSFDRVVAMVAAMTPEAESPQFQPYINNLILGSLDGKIALAKLESLSRAYAHRCEAERQFVKDIDVVVSENDILDIFAPDRDFIEPAFSNERYLVSIDQAQEHLIKIKNMNRSLTNALDQARSLSLNSIEEKTRQEMLVDELDNLLQTAKKLLSDIQDYIGDEIVNYQ